jgi:hypothetical protein
MGFQPPTELHRVRCAQTNRPVSSRSRGSCSNPSSKSRVLLAPATRPPTGNTSGILKVVSSTPCIVTPSRSKASGSTRSRATSSASSATNSLALASVIFVLTAARQKICVIGRKEQVIIIFRKSLCLVELLKVVEDTNSRRHRNIRFVSCCLRCLWRDSQILNVSLFRYGHFPYQK